MKNRLIQLLISIFALMTLCQCGSQEPSGTALAQGHSIILKSKSDDDDEPLVETVPTPAPAPAPAPAPTVPDDSYKIEYCASLGTGENHCLQYLQTIPDDWCNDTYSGFKEKAICKRSDGDNENSCQGLPSQTFEGSTCCNGRWVPNSVDPDGFIVTCNQ